MQRRGGLALQDQTRLYDILSFVALDSRGTYNLYSVTIHVLNPFVTSLHNGPLSLYPVIPRFKRKLANRPFSPTVVHNS